MFYWKWAAALMTATVVLVGFGCRPASRGNLASSHAQAPPAPEEEKPSPETDEWETEHFAEEAAAQLKLLGKAISRPGTIGLESAKGVLASDFSCGRLRPNELATAFSDDHLTVRRSEGAGLGGDFRGNKGLADALAALAGLSDIHVKFKIVSVDAGDGTISTDAVYQAAGRTQSESVQQTARWKCRWSQTDAKPLLERIQVESFEEVTGRAPTGALFADCTRDVFRREPSFAQQLALGTDYWRRAIQAQYGVHAYGHQGVAVGDVNGDGLDDLYVCQPSGLPNRLYLQQEDGAVVDAAASYGVDWLDRSRGALLIDLDNDGDQDLVATVSKLVLIMSNNNAQSFSEKTVFRPVGDASSLAAADYDLDGDLDVYVSSYGSRFLSDGHSPGPVPYHDANNGGENMLLRNDGDWKFTDVTQECGLGENNRRWSFAASWEDYDADGDPDLYVANDFGRNNLYRNDKGRFVDVAAQAGVEDIAAGMSVSWGDYNLDGHMDLYVGNMFSSAGQRIAFQDRFQADARQEVRAEFQRHARGNSLFLNQGNGAFRDVSVEAGVTLGRWAWSSNFVDINNDGLEDLVVANGFVTGSDTKDL